jgi:hypothetical protein
MGEGTAARDGLALSSHINVADIAGTASTKLNSSPAQGAAPGRTGGAASNQARPNKTGACESVPRGASFSRKAFAASFPGSIAPVDRAGSFFGKFHLSEFPDSHC